MCCSRVPSFHHSCEYVHQSVENNWWLWPVHGLRWRILLFNHYDLDKHPDHQSYYHLWVEDGYSQGRLDRLYSRESYIIPSEHDMFWAFCRVVAVTSGLQRSTKLVQRESGANLSFTILIRPQVVHILRRWSEYRYRQSTHSRTWRRARLRPMINSHWWIHIRWIYSLWYI